MGCEVVSFENTAWAEKAKAFEIDAAVYRSIPSDTKPQPVRNRLKTMKNAEISFCFLVWMTSTLRKLSVLNGEVFKNALVWM